MSSILKNALPVLFIIFSAAIISCSKDPVPDKGTVLKNALIAHTWQIEKATEYTAGRPVITYQRGAAGNTDDYSAVRQTYKANGTITFTDELGAHGDNGTYELLDNYSKIKLGFQGNFIVGENLQISTTIFAYTFKYGSDSSRFVFSKAQ